MKIFIFVLCLSLSSLAFAFEPDWGRNFQIPAGGRNNPYDLSQSEFLTTVNNGKIHTQIYPVEVTGLLPPYEPLRKFIEEPSSDPFKKLLQKIFQGFSDVSTVNDLFTWMGMNEYPLESDAGVYSVPYPNQKRPDHLMGFGIIEKNGAKGFSISCAECHSSRLFGKTVLGLTNRFPKANETFIRAKQAAGYLNPWTFQHYSKATDAETDLLKEMKRNLKAVGVKQPLALGLDTSLAQVSMSLARRNKDAFATKSDSLQNNPRQEPLTKLPADSKPAVWWNLKYKNRWLSDGSVVSGNPVFTNILWNEIGRGADLETLNQWLQDNSQKIKELTSAVFSIEAPRFNDFFPAEMIDLTKAQRGEKIFESACAKCHGSYDKAWNLPDSKFLSAEERLKTINVRYPWPTVVKDVGTDANRYKGMKSLEQLNDLEISKQNGTLVESQTGYVPPPLVGIWARWPYFHNNSAPSLCAVLTKASDRPKTYYSGAANDPIKDFDSVCNGYPLGDQTPKAWKTKEHLYDTRQEGLRNTGHDERIFLENGKERFSKEEKLALIQFLQTL